MSSAFLNGWQWQIFALYVSQQVHIFFFFDQDYFSATFKAFRPTPTLTVGLACGFFESNRWNNTGKQIKNWLKFKYANLWKQKSWVWLKVTQWSRNLSVFNFNYKPSAPLRSCDSLTANHNLIWIIIFLLIYLRSTESQDFALIFCHRFVTKSTEKLFGKNDLFIFHANLKDILR